MTDDDKALVKWLRDEAALAYDREDTNTLNETADRIEAQAAEIEYWKTEARNVRRELKSEQKQADSAMDNYDAMQRRCEAQAAEIEKLREAVKEIKDAWDWWQVDTYDRCASAVDDAISAALGETK